MSVAYKPEFPFPSSEAFGRPGSEPLWQRASKQGVGTALSAFSRVWFTIADGVVTETYYPDAGTACIRDLKFLVTDSRTFFNEEGTDTDITQLEQVHEYAPGYVVTNTAKSGLWSVTKRIITDPQANSLVINTTFRAIRGTPTDFRLFVLLAPHIGNSGYGNSARCAPYGRRNYLLASRNNIALALAADRPFLKMSAGYSGTSDGWHDLRDNLDMDWRFEKAPYGNVALTAELQPEGEFNLVLSFGKDEVEAVLETERTLTRKYADIEREYIRGWRKYLGRTHHLGRRSVDKGRRFLTSASILKAHEDKTWPGAIVPSLSIPWGEAMRGEEALGYHIIRPADLCKGAFAFLALGDNDTALSILNNLQSVQTDTGSWHRSMEINGEVVEPVLDLTQTALPVILAWRLKGLGLIGDSYYPMVKKAAAYIARVGPSSGTERWEEGMGFSPAELAAEISALVCGAYWADEMNEKAASKHLLSTADYWQTKLEDWTFSECDCIGEGISGHYLRIVHDVPEKLSADEALYDPLVFNRGRPKDRPHHQGEIVDTGFLDLVRYGVRGPRDPHVVNSLRVVDRLLRFEHNGRIAFRRFFGDGYGEKEDGSPFDGTGVGRPWPLLTGERAMYEIISGGTPEEYVRSLESFANEGHLFPEQIWDSGNIPERGLYKGRPTGSATPLVWAHAEYIKVLRSMRDNAGFDIIEEVKERYADRITKLHMSAWKKDKLISSAKNTDIVRIISYEDADLVWTKDNWATRNEEPMSSTGLGIWNRDFDHESFAPGTKLIFTFRYRANGAWEGRDYEINIWG